MRKLAHKDGTAGFGDLTFAEQAKSITAAINNLQNAVDHHVKRAPNPADTRKKCLQQVHRMLGRLIERSFIVVLVLMLTGCGAGSSPEADAKAALKAQLDRWVAGESGGIASTGFDKPAAEIGAVLLDHDIKTFSRMTEGTQPLLYKDGDWYRATVNLTFQSKAGTEIKRQHQWIVYRENKQSPWKFEYDILRG